MIVGFSTASVTNTILRTARIIQNSNVRLHDCVSMGLLLRLGSLPRTEIVQKTFTHVKCLTAAQEKENTNNV